MSYRLQKEESVVAGLKRIAETEITGAISRLQSHGLKSEQDLGHRIYAVRKHLKKVRAILQLLQPYLGPIYREENRRLRDVSRHLSAFRDLDVALELLDTFAAEYKRKTVLDPHRQILSKKLAALNIELNRQGELPLSIETLVASRKRVEDWPLHGLTFAFLDSQVKKTHKQSRSRFRRAKQTRTAEDFHELRKSVKRELNQCRLLTYPESHLSDLKELARLLGDHHNLSVLLASLETPSGRFLARAQKKRKLFEAQIVLLASRLYENDPRAAAAA